MLTIRDNSSDFCVNLTRLPTIANNYIDSWHTSDFTINLAPDYSVNETFYTINNGPVCNITANGLPTITTEGSSNRLEYWSTWNVYGTGSMELSHVTLTGIKLDKTSPTSSITVNSNYVNSGAMVTFDAGGSSDVSGIVSYLWDFGDDTTGTGMTTTHTYSSAGTYAARMTVQDTAGNTATATVTIVVQTPQPTPSPSPSPTIKPTSTTSPSPTPSSDSSTTPQVPEYPALIVLFFMLTAMAIVMFTKKGATKIRK
jgi:PKD repeat protein